MSVAESHPHVVHTPPKVRRATKSSWAGFAVIVALVLMAPLAPYVVDKGVQGSLVTLFALIVMATMWNLLAGYGGMLSIGQQAYIGIGAYALVYLSDTVGLDPFMAVPLAVVVAGAALVSDLVPGLPPLRWLLRHRHLGHRHRGDAHRPADPGAGRGHRGDVHRVQRARPTHAHRVRLLALAGGRRHHCRGDLLDHALAARTRVHRHPRRRCRRGIARRPRDPLQEVRVRRVRDGVRTRGSNDHREHATRSARLDLLGQLLRLHDLHRRDRGSGDDRGADPRCRSSSSPFSSGWRTSGRGTSSSSVSSPSSSRCSCRAGCGGSSPAMGGSDCSPSATASCRPGSSSASRRAPRLNRSGPVGVAAETHAAARDFGHDFPCPFLSAEPGR